MRRFRCSPLGHGLEGLGIRAFDDPHASREDEVRLDAHSPFGVVVNRPEGWDLVEDAFFDGRHGGGWNLGQWLAGSRTPSGESPHLSILSVDSSVC